MKSRSEKIKTPRRLARGLLTQGLGLAAGETIANTT